MRILLDECVPRRPRRELPGHDVHTVPEMSWSGKKNGEPLRLAAGQGCEVLLTVDQNVHHQHSLLASVAVVVLIAASNRLADLAPLTPSALAALGSNKLGDVIEITA